MRVVPLVGLLALLGAALLYLTVLRYREARFAALVPDDALFTVVYRSTNGLREFYEGPVQREDLDPALRRIGERVNVPGLDGIDYDAPVGSYYTASKSEVFLVPYVDYGAFVDAWEVARENTRLQEPERPAANYLSVSTSGERARIGDPHPLVRRALGYPVAVAGRPVDGGTVAAMLYALLAPESRQQPRGLEPMLLQNQLLRLPEIACTWPAATCEELLVGCAKPADGPARMTVDVVATPDPGGALATAAEVADAVDLGALVGALPLRTKLFAGAVLPGAGWRGLGMPLPCGDAAVVLAIVEPSQRHLRRWNVLVAVEPADADAIALLEAEGVATLLGAVAPPAELRALDDRGTVVRTGDLAAPPAWLATVLRSDAQDPPPVTVTVASRDGRWLCAVGSQSERVVREALACLRGSEQLSVRAYFNEGDAAGSVGTPIVPMRAVFDPHGLAAGMLTAEGMQALRWPMPYVELGSIGQPEQVCWRGDPDDDGRLATRIALYR